MDAPSLSAGHEGPVLIGREPELSAFADLLDGRSPEYPLPAVVVVSGERGMGKTSLIRVFEVRAARAGWKTAFIDLQARGAGEATGIDAFCADVRHKLGFERDDAFVETVSSSAERTASAAPHAAPERIVLAAPSFAQELSDRSRSAPLLIVIDQFEAGHPWAPWLRERFLPDMKASRARAVVALTCHPDDVAALSQPGTKVFELGALPEESLRQRLADIGQGLNPPLTPAELEGYASDPDMKPGISGSLLRLLELIRREGGPASERPEHSNVQ